MAQPKRQLPVHSFSVLATVPFNESHFHSSLGEVWDDDNQKMIALMIYQYRAFYNYQPQHFLISMASPPGHDEVCITNLVMQSTQPFTIVEHEKFVMISSRIKTVSFQRFPPNAKSTDSSVGKAQVSHTHPAGSNP